MKAELKGLVSPDLTKPHTPDDPGNCAVLMEAELGPKGQEGAEIFTFVVVTPKWLEANVECRWGRGYLLVPEFSWHELERMLGRLVSATSGESWDEIANSLSKFMDWEFERYEE